MVGSPKSLSASPHGWRLKADKSDVFGELGARMLIGADGRNSWVAHHLGLADPAAMQGRSVGFQFRLKCANRSTGKVEIHLFPGGYAGVVGLDGDTVTLGLAIEKHRLLDGRPEQSLLKSILPQNPWLKETASRRASVIEMRSTYPVYFPPRRAYADGVLLVGDAARVNEPVTGEGIYFALKSGVFAARTVDEAISNERLLCSPFTFLRAELPLGFPRASGNQCVYSLAYLPARASLTCYSTLSQENTVVGSDRSNDLRTAAAG